jgi:predicted amidohydrolase
MGAFLAACVQVNAQRDYAPSLARALALGRDAAMAGAQLIAFPENVSMIEPDNAAALAKAEPAERHPGIPAFSGLARETGAWILGGSLNIKRSDGKVANRSMLFAPDGAVVASYDKIHLFDVDLPNGETYRESARIAPGDRAVTAETPWCRIGLSVCYDLRFAALYRALAQAGAVVLTIPSAFTVPTGSAHWHVLMRARAIETGSFVVAPAQWGTHAGGRRTYGHSLIVDPWGEILAEMGDGEGFVTARIDPARAIATRRSIPSLDHDRPFAPPAERRAAE